MKMKAPPGATNAVVLGHPYEVVDGHVEAAHPSHVKVLKVLGYREARATTPVVDPEDEFDDVPDIFDQMKKAELVEYVEERGGEVVKPIKMAALRAQARELSTPTENKED